MNKVNFNAFRDIKASGELIEKTLAAAQKADGAEAPEPAAEPVKRRRLSLGRRFAIAASFVLAFGISISVFFYIRNINNSPIPIAPVSDATCEPTSETAPDAASVTAASPTEPSAAGTDAPAQSGTQPPTSHPTEAPTVGGTTAPVHPSVKPTQKPAVTPTVKPTEKPTVKPTEKPTQSPTQGPVIIYDPTEIMVEDPGEHAAPILIRGWLTEDIRLNAQVVYCRVETSGGVPVGDSDLYSNEHKVVVIKAYKYVDYDPAARGLMLTPGDWNYYFYDADGNVFDEGQLHVN